MKRNAKGIGRCTSNGMMKVSWTEILFAKSDVDYGHIKKRFGGQYKARPIHCIIDQSLKKSF